MVIRTRKLNFRKPLLVVISNMIHSGIFLQNTTNTICDSYVITKCSKSLLQNISGFLLQNVTVLFPIIRITKKKVTRATGKTFSYLIQYVQTKYYFSFRMLPSPELQRKY